MPVLKVILLNGGPVLPPGELTIPISIEIVEARVEIKIGNNSVWGVVTTEHHVILFVPLVKCHDSIVDQCLHNISFTFRIIPEASDELIVPIVLVLLPLLNDAVLVGVSESKLVTDVGFEAHIVVEDVVEGQDCGQDRLEVLTSVSLLADVIVGALRWIAPHVGEKLIFDCREGRQVTLKVDGRVLHSIGLKELTHADFLVVVKV